MAKAAFGMRNAAFGMRKGLPRLSSYSAYHISGSNEPHPNRLCSPFPDLRPRREATTRLRSFRKAGKIGSTTQIREQTLFA